ncbi:cob(I)yrinic acid a,c-diamide adenosyltransferase [candidate division KSB1 bacterium]|nr:cob(I)yrinic acid a,c-diamide adenosyltransferase [candidate division KSB1 bacterium]
MQRKKADVYTRTGDEGTTALFGGSRIEKDSARVEAYGTIDELCAVISVVKTTEISRRVFDVLTKLQDYCHDINAEIASDEEGIKSLKKRITKEDVSYLENLIDEFDAELPKLTHFIVPAVKPSTAFLNLARTVCRRAERRLWALHREHRFNENILVFFNRLADLLFTFMRYEGKDGVME